MSRLIRAESIEGAPVAWQVPDVTRPRPVPAAAPEAAAAPPPDLAALREQAWQQGYEEGRIAGLEAGAREIAERCAAIERALDALARPLEDTGHRVEEELLALVQAVVRQLIRREVQLDPTHIVGVIREGLAALPLGSGEVSVRLHPADAAVVRECLTEPERDRAWRIEADPLMERGGCVITTPNSLVDARLDARLARVMSLLAGDERSDHG